MGRVAIWRSTNGQAVAERISPILDNKSQSLCLKGVLYDARDMKTGIDVKKLEHYEKELNDLFELDERGAHFGQPDMEASLEMQYKKEELAASVQQLAARKQFSPLELRADQAYAWRVMLSHCREKHADYMTFIEKNPFAPQPPSHPAWLIKLYRKIQDAKPPIPTQAVGAAPAPKPTVHPNGPFVHFRPMILQCYRDLEGDSDDIDGKNPEEDSGDGDDEGSDEVEYPTVVKEGWEHNMHAAARRYSDGIIEKAVSYKKGPNCFIIAVFKDESTIELEISNSRLLANGTIDVICMLGFR